MFIIRLFILGLLCSGIMGCQVMAIDDNFFGEREYEPENSAEEEPENSVVETRDRHEKSILSAFSTLSNTSFQVEDEQKAQQVLENNFTYQSSRWWTKDKELDLTPIRVFSSKKGEFCREYHAKLISKNDEVKTKAVACRKKGVWFRQD